MRFECDSGRGYARVFPETFSFRADRHDPAELFLQLDDLSRKPELLGPRANRRDAELLVSRLAIGVPRYLERLIERLEGRIDEAALLRVHEDVALLAQTFSRVLGDREGGDTRGRRAAGFHLRKILWRSLAVLVERRVDPAVREAYVDGSADLVDPADDLSEAGFFYALERGTPETVNRVLLRLAERAFLRWVEDVCLDESNRAFEVDHSPFGDRELEVRRAIGAREDGDLVRAGDLTLFLRRPRNRDCLRVLRKLSHFFLRQYDVYHAAALIRHTDDMAAGRVDRGRVLSRHRLRNYALLLAFLAAPFVGGALAYDSAPRFFDAVCAAELGAVGLGVVWFLAYRFCWRRDLTFFHASVPRVTAGIVVGFLPIFFIDEVWSLANRSWVILGMVSLLLGFTTLLYLYVEVQRKLGDTELSFARARQIFVLGLLQAFGAGLLITGLTGGFMATRNWSPGDAVLPISALGEALPPVVGQLPKVVGIDPFYTFPAPVFLMAFLSFFIGTFLQLLWEDIPITEPL